MDEVFNYIVNAQLEKSKIHKSYGIHKYCDAIYALTQDAELLPSVPEDLIEFIKNYNDISLIVISQAVEYLPIDELEKIRKQLVDFDLKQDTHKSYSALSAEFILLNCVQSVFDEKENPEEIRWAVEKKLERSAQLMREKSPFNGGKMGIFIEAASVLDSITGNNVPEGNGFYKKSSDLLASKSIVAMLNYSNKAYEMQQKFDGDIPNVYVAGDMISNNYSIYDTIIVRGSDDPYGTIEDQEIMLEHINKIAKMLHKTSFGTLTPQFLKSSMDIENNISKYKSNPSSSFRLNLS